MRRFRPFWSVVLTLAAGTAGCGDVGPTNTGRTTTGGGTSVIVPRTNPLVGKWSFARYLVDDTGATHLSQTVWDFGSTGAVTRTLSSDNLSTGYGDVIVRTGRWTASGGTLQVTFDDTTAPVSYSYYFEGDALVLAGTSFIRLAT